MYSCFTTIHLCHRPLSNVKLDDKTSQLHQQMSNICNITEKNLKKEKHFVELKNDYSKFLNIKSSSFSFFSNKLDNLKENEN